ncbi:hypothetical protein C8J56DRAFT_1059968 [Mycena floridula]|nr:hypothetical protein C8J56DRAFT_1059968 [Mycena floridula]
MASLVARGVSSCFLRLPLSGSSSHLTRWTSQLALFSQLLDAQYDTNQAIHLSADPYDDLDDDTDDEMLGLIDTWDSDSGYGSA